MKRLFIPATFFLIAICTSAAAQKKDSKNPVYVDSRGVLRWSKDNTEASFFGVNYTLPFAYGYRSHKALGADLEKAIDADVHHMARLGLDAFRVHVWDVEISDSTGNLLQNEHLRLFDYLLFKLKQKGIKVLLTPIAFWGNGYPEKDEATTGFSTVYGKRNSVVLEVAIKAQEVYIKQFFQHVNPYTKLTYTADPDVIAMEINNEPHHSGPKARTTEYINRLAAAARSTGWSKPVFYNISESPSYADAVVQSAVAGHSFQWYPTGLVAGHELKGNFLPHVDAYTIPFGDTIPAFHSRAKMVYEFDAGDVLQPIMYPAMARSFRKAGFQWATQFAYDPMVTAHANTEYQTHYLNLAYTPAKAISLLIAARAFQTLPRLKSYGAYPADTLFGAFRVSYAQQLSEMNTDEEFYHSNSTLTPPKNTALLQHIAGVGSSPLVQYEGTGAYFFDKVAAGTWRLEVMPDVVYLRDPFEKASPKKEVTRIQWQENKMQLLGLSGPFEVETLDAGNKHSIQVEGTAFSIAPGTYLVKEVSVTAAPSSYKLPAGLRLNDFYAPGFVKQPPFVVHQPAVEVSAGMDFRISAKIAGLSTSDKVTAEVRNTAGQWKTITLQKLTAYDYGALIPADMVVPGMINYRIMIENSHGIASFPGGLQGDPYAWDEHRNESWTTFVSPAGANLALFTAGEAKSTTTVFNPDWKNNVVAYTASNAPLSLALKTAVGKASSARSIAWQYYFKERISGRKSELINFSKIVIKVRGTAGPKGKLSLVTGNAIAYSSPFVLTGVWQEVEIAIGTLKKSDYLLLPRPYPGFLPLQFSAASETAFNMTDAEVLQVSFTAPALEAAGIEVESVYLKK